MLLDGLIGAMTPICGCAVYAAVSYGSNADASFSSDKSNIKEEVHFFIVIFFAGDFFDTEMLR